MEEEKTCKNCNYYVPHYIMVQENFNPIIGHCVHEKFYRKTQKFKLQTNCSAWREREKQNNKARIKASIERMERHLRDIKNILNLIEKDNHE